MAATILNSKRAASMSLYVVKAFVRMRREFSANATLERRLKRIEDTLLIHDTAMREVYAKLKPLLTQPESKDEPRKEMGYHTILQKP